MFMENERLLLHPLRDEDLDSLTRFVNDPKIYRYEPTYLPELQDSPEKILTVLQKTDLCRDRQCVLGIYEKKTPEILAGLAELYDYKRTGKVISVGYRLAEEFWGKGIGSSCVQALLRFIRNETEVSLVTAHVIPDNIASAKVLLKNGFEYLFTKQEDWGHGHPTTADVYTYDCPERKETRL